MNIESVYIRNRRATQIGVGLTLTVALVAMVRALDKTNASSAPAAVESIVASETKAASLLVDLKLLTAFESGIPKRIEEALSRLSQADRDEQLRRLLLVLPSSSERNTAITLLGELGSLSVFWELYAELIRPQWTDNWDMRPTVQEIRDTHPKQAHRILLVLFSWRSEERRPQTAARALMLLTGYIPRTKLNVDDRRTVLEVATEFAHAFASLRGKLPSMKVRLERLLGMIADHKEDPGRVEAAIWVASRYAGWRYRVYVIERYLSETDPRTRVDEWRPIIELLKKEGHSDARDTLDSLGIFLMKTVGLCTGL